MNYKDQTKASYDRNAEAFDKYFQKSFDEVVGQSAAQEFLKLKPGPIMLDLGSGPGNHAKFFADQGFDVTCLDISEPLLEKCREKGLRTIQADLENLHLPNEQYDWIWAYASLLHVPRRKIPRLIKELSKTLKPNGLLAIAVKEGRGQKYEVNKNFEDVKRWFVYFSKEELGRLVEPYFEMFYFNRSVVSGKATFLHFFLRKK